MDMLPWIARRKKNNRFIIAYLDSESGALAVQLMDGNRASKRGQQQTHRVKVTRPCRHGLFQKLDRDTKKVVRACPGTRSPDKLPHSDEDVLCAVKLVQCPDKLGLPTHS